MKLNAMTKKQLIEKINQLNQQVEKLSDKSAISNQIDNSKFNLSTLIENSIDGLIVEAESKVLIVNQKFCDLFGIKKSPNELINTDYNQVIKSVKSLFVKSTEYVNKIKENLAEKKARHNTELELKDGRVFKLYYKPINNDGENNLNLWFYREITEERNIEKSLFESRRRLISAQLIAKIGDFVWDLNTGNVTWSDAMYKLLDYDKSELINYDIINNNIHHPDDADRITKWLQDSISSRKHELTANEYRIMRKNGEIIYVRAEGIVEYAKRKPLRVVATIQDITDRKQTEETLILERALSNTIIDSLPGVFYLFDSTGKFLRWNNNFEIITGYSSKEFARLSPLALFKGEQRKLIEEKIKNVFETGKAYVEAEITTKDGHLIPYYFTGRRIELNGSKCLIGMGVDITEQKKSEAALKNAEQKLRNVVEHSTNLFYSHDNNHVLTYVSPQAKFYFGCDPEEAIVRWTEFITDNPINKKGIEITQRAIDTGQIQPPYELELKTKDGRNLWVEVNEAPVIKNKKTVGIVGALIDVTERKKSKLALEESEEKFRTLVETSADMVFQVNRNGIIEYVSPRSVELYGYRADELIGKYFKNTTPINELPKSLEALRRILSGANLVNFEINQISKSGKFIPMEINASPVIRDNKIWGFQGIMRDITDRKQAEDALRASESQFRELWEATVEGIAIHDRGELLEVNAALCGMMGYKREQIIGQSLYDFTPTEVHKLMRKRIASRQIGSFEMPAIHITGKKLALEVFAKEISYGGKQVRMIAVRDISERKKAEAEIIMAKEIAENSEKLKSEFLAQMSHEIRTPINAILSFSSLLKEEIGDLVPKELGSAFNIMNNAGQRIIRTIDLILNMSEIQTGTFTPEIREFDIFEDILIPFSTQYKMICKEKGLKIKIKRTGKNFNVKADEYTVTQIFDNLLGNAVKYTLEGEIEINVRRNKSTIRIEISDTGIGISKEYLPNLFTPFTQEEQGYTRKFEGTGLGLALVKKYCDLNNAEIECESEKGKGTIFRITFPVST